MEVILREHVDHLGAPRRRREGRRRATRATTCCRASSRWRSPRATSARSSARRSSPKRARRREARRPRRSRRGSAQTRDRDRPPRRRERHALRLGDLGRHRRRRSRRGLRDRQAQDPAARSDQGARRVHRAGEGAPRRHRAGEGAASSPSEALAAGSSRQLRRAVVGRDRRLLRSLVSPDRRSAGHGLILVLFRAFAIIRSMRRNLAARHARTHASAQPRGREVGARRDPDPQRGVQPRRGGDRRARLLPRRAPPHLRQDGRAQRAQRRRSTSSR